MSDHNHLDDEDVLLAFAVEPQHDRATLERYLRSHPHLADDLIDLSLDMRLWRASGGASTPVDDAWVEESWAAFQATMPAKADAAVANPFATASTEELVAVRRKLGVPSGVIQGFSTRLVDIATVPAWIVDAIAQGVRTGVGDLRAFMAGQTRLATGLSYKSDEAPAAAAAKITFEELLIQCRVPDNKRRELLEDRD
jgi:hypothetical protein